MTARKKEQQKQEKHETRPPVVVVLGHVDHGKSSILEAIKDFKITSKESGGITQHIGAYEVEHEGKKITFIDTPGHEAFSAMRSRGAKVADIAILVVAADEGVKPQTKEAITHIKKAELPLIVAINKIDKPEANPEKVKRELAAQDIIVESMGGKVPFAEVSAKTRKGIPHLLELISLVAELEELKVELQKPAEGFVIEAYLDSQRGPTATLIVQNGILKKGDTVGTISAYGKVKMLMNFQGIPVEQGLPAMPVVVIGFEEVPGVGEAFKAFPNLESAQNQTTKITQAPFVQKTMEADAKTVNLILKVDVLGSLEAVQEVLKSLPQDKVGLKIIKAEVGDIGENDIKLAKSTRSRIIGFRVKAKPLVQNLAVREKVRILTFDIIYELAQAVRQFLEKLVEPETVRADLGKVKILALFLDEKNRQIIGGKVMAGKIKRGTVEVYRGEALVGRGKIVSLQRDKKEIDEVAKGFECGMMYEGDVKVEAGDVLASYTEQRQKGEL